MIIVVALGSALLYAVASVLQHHTARAQPHSSSMRVGLLVGLAARPLWVVGVVSDAAAYVLQFIALGHGSLVLVQPLLVSGLLFALPVGGALSHRRLTRLEWLGSAAVVIGLASFLVVASPGPGHHPRTITWVVTLVATLVPTALLVLAAPAHQGPGRATMLAAAAGVLYGLTAALTEVTARLLEHGVIHLFTSWEPYALVACGVTGLVVGQSAFQAGPLRLSLPMLTVVDPVVSIVIGALAFQERVATAGAAPVLEVLGLVVMGIGTFLLARSPLVVGTE